MPLPRSRAGSRLSSKRCRQAQGQKALREEQMDLIADRGRRITWDEVSITKLLAHAAEKARYRINANYTAG